MTRTVPALLGLLLACSTSAPSHDGDTDLDAPGADTDGATDTDAGAGDRSGAIGGEVGDCAPDFVLRDAEGVRHRLSDLRVRVVALDLSTMWCTFCKQAAPTGESLHKAYGDDLASVTVLWEDVDGNDPDADDLATWSETFGLTHLVLADEGAATRDAWGGPGRPVLLVVDRRGRVTFRANGARLEDWEDAVADAVGN